MGTFYSLWLGPSRLEMFLLGWWVYSLGISPWLAHGLLPLLLLHPNFQRHIPFPRPRLCLPSCLHRFAASPAHGRGGAWEQERGRLGLEGVGFSLDISV